VLARDAMAVGGNPVVKYRDLAVGGGMNVELDDIGRQQQPNRMALQLACGLSALNPPVTLL
jgi:hypothetical protein